MKPISDIRASAPVGIAGLLVLLVGLLWEQPARAQDDEVAEPEEAPSCISCRRIHRIRILDDRNVLIYVNARTIFHNELQRTCRGLKREGTFSYNSSDGLLCSGDGIASLNGLAWDDVRPVPSCWLGDHRRVTKEEADAMRKAARRPRTIAPKPVATPEPTEVGGDSEKPKR